MQTSKPDNKTICNSTRAIKKRTKKKKKKKKNLFNTIFADYLKKEINNYHYVPFRCSAFVARKVTKHIMNIDFIAHITYLFIKTNEGRY